MAIPKVSVVVPNYNYARFLRRRIDTILRQTFQDFELILLDDCSTDESRRILAEYAGDPRVRLDFNEFNSGSTFHQWNKGVSLSRGEYVWIAESDDWSDIRFLERLVTALNAEPEASFAYCRSWRVTEDDEVDGLGDWYLERIDPLKWKADFCADGNREFVEYLCQCCVVPNASATVFRRACYLKAGGADESFRVCGDWKMWAAMALEGKVAFVADRLNYYRLHASSVLHGSIRDAVNVTESLDAVRWILDRVSLPQTALDKIYQMRVDSWVPVVMSFHHPVRLKLKIINHARKFDPYFPKRVWRPALQTIRRKFDRHWRALGIRGHNRNIAANIATTSKARSEAQAASLAPKRDWQNDRM